MQHATLLSSGNRTRHTSDTKQVAVRGSEVASFPICLAVYSLYTLSNEFKLFHLKHGTVLCRVKHVCTGIRVSNVTMRLKSKRKETSSKKKKNLKEYISHHASGPHVSQSAGCYLKLACIKATEPSSLSLPFPVLFEWKTCPRFSSVRPHSLFLIQ